MNDVWLLLLLVVAVAIGWLLGRFKRPSTTAKPSKPLGIGQEYFAGLDYLLNERTDEAIESFIKVLEVNSDTIPAHIALAKLFRRKGDVQRAIKIHQNLLARPDLDRSEFMRVQMALAKDYYAAGLLDRAENLLKKVIAQRPLRDTQVKAQLSLIRLYETEKEWLKALNVANGLPPDERRRIGKELAHYCCELADKALKAGAYSDVVSHLRQAEQHDSQSVRVSILNGELAIERENARSAIKAFKQVAERDALFTPVILTALKLCYERSLGVEAYVSYLRSVMSSKPTTSVMLEIANHIAETQGPLVAAHFVTEELKKRPSVKGFNRLVEFQLAQSEGRASDELRVLRGLTGQLEVIKPTYRCTHCGFSGKTLIWHCPSCKQWGTTKPAQGLEGE